MAANKVKIEICGSTYVLASADDEAYVQSLAEHLNSDMQSVMEATPSASITTAAVVTAMDYLDEMSKSKKSADNMRAQLKEYLDDAGKAKQTAAELLKQNEILKQQIALLQGGKIG